MRVGVRRSRFSTIRRSLLAGCLVAPLATAAGWSGSTPAPAPAETASCDAPQAREFDFWIGDWAIDQRLRARDGSWIRLPAKTSVSSILDGCAILERWEGEVQFFWEGMEAPEPLEALSVRAYDPASGSWRIHWMDTRSARFGEPFVGGFDEGRGEFRRTTSSPDGERVSRIVFRQITQGSVHWELAVSSDGGQTWRPLWIMEMRREGTAGGPKVETATPTNATSPSR